MNNNLKNIQVSGIRRFANKVEQVDGAISLTIGQPDFNTPEKVKKAMIDAIANNKTVYTSNLGLLELRSAISDYLGKMNIFFDADEVCITVGGSEGLFSVFTALVNPKDKVVIPTPAYPAYESIVKILGGEVVNCGVNEDFSINLTELENIIKLHKPKILVLSYPSNPTGAILDKESCETLYKIIKENNIIAITDEMYSCFCFDDEYYSVSQYADIKEKIVYLGGFSKMLSMTGLRVGFACAHKDLMKEILKVHQYNVSCAPSISQYGAIVGIKECSADIEYMKNELISRRNFVFKRLKEIGFNVVLPKGAFYIFPSIKEYNLSSEEFCDRLLFQGKVAVVPGSAFGSGGEGYFRLSYAASMEQLEEALNRMEAHMSTLKTK